MFSIDHFLERESGISAVAHERKEVCGGGKPAGGGIDLQIFDADFEEIARVLLIENRKIPRPTHLSRLHPQDAICDRMERAAPKARHAPAEQAFYARKHFAGGFVGKGQKKNL